MGTEIERRFLVISDEWRQNAKGVTYRQGFLVRDRSRLVRVRMTETEGFVTIKGKTLKDGVTKPEYEYEIPKKDAKELLAMCLPAIIVKKRHKIMHKGHLWEVDVFEGDNSGLVIAEIELKSLREKFEKPAWLGREITGESRYSNASLSEKPYKKWKKSDKRKKR